VKIDVNSDHYFDPREPSFLVHFFSSKLIDRVFSHLPSGMPKFGKVHATGPLPMSAVVQRKVLPTETAKIVPTQLIVSSDAFLL
jgi:hypothetical protein